MAWPCACLTGCNAKWPIEEFDIVHLGSDPNNQHIPSFMQWHIAQYMPIVQKVALGTIVR